MASFKDQDDRDEEEGDFKPKAEDEESEGTSKVVQGQMMMTTMTMMIAMIATIATIAITAVVRAKMMTMRAARSGAKTMMRGKRMRMAQRKRRRERAGLSMRTLRQSIRVTSFLEAEGEQPQLRVLRPRQTPSQQRVIAAPLPTRRALCYQLMIAMRKRRNFEAFPLKN